MSTPDEIKAPQRFSGWIGHFLTVLVAGTGVGVSYGALDARVSDVERRVLSLETTILQEIKDMDKNLTEVKVKIAEIQSDVRWLKDEKDSEK